MVTLQGELLESGGALVGGAAPRTGIHFGTAERKDIDELSNDIRNLEAEKLQLSSELSDIIREAGQLATTRQELESEKAAFQTRVTDYDGRTGEIKKRLQEADDAVKIREGLVEGLQGEIIERTGLLEGLEKDIQKEATKIRRNWY
jgi:chromosome segregation ATPase